MTAKTRIQCAPRQCIEIFGSTKECVRTPVTRTGIHGIPGRLGYHPICIANIVSYRSLPSHINKPYKFYYLPQVNLSAHAVINSKQVDWKAGNQGRCWDLDDCPARNQEHFVTCSDIRIKPSRTSEPPERGIQRIEISEKTFHSGYNF